KDWSVPPARPAQREPWAQPVRPVHKDWSVRMDRSDPPGLPELQDQRAQQVHKVWSVLPARLAQREHWAQPARRGHKDWSVRTDRSDPPALPAQQDQRELQVHKVWSARPAQRELWVRQVRKDWSARMGRSDLLG